MATIKAYTDIEQSKKLSTFLPIESADMYYYTVNGDLYKTPNVIETNEDLYVDESSVPCWSLAALLNILPKVEGFKPIIDLDINLIRYEGSLRDTLVADNDELVDAVVEVIIWLHEQNLL